MADDCPPPLFKRLKVERPFYKNVKTHAKKYADIIIKALKKLDTDQWATFCFLKIINCNGAYPCSFSQAWCQTSRNIQDPDESKHRIVYFTKLFDIELLRQFFDCSTMYLDDSRITDSQLAAFKRLATFLDSLDDTKIIFESQSVGTMEEGAWAAVFCTHVLSKLSVSEQMTMDAGYPDKTTVCPCGCKTPIKIGDNSMGHEAVWHGSVDILLGSVAVVSSSHSAEQSDEISDESNSAKSELEEARNQIIAETIVFSFTKKIGLVPTIAISKESLKIFLYDPQSDLLYESSEIVLFEPLKGMEFNITTIVALWLAVNYNQFCTGVKSTHEEFGYTANFKAVVNDAFKIYQEGIKMGGCSHVKNLIGKFKAPENIGRFPSVDD